MCPVWAQVCLHGDAVGAVLVPDDRAHRLEGLAAQQELGDQPVEDGVGDVERQEEHLTALADPPSAAYLELRGQHVVAVLAAEGLPVGAGREHPEHGEHGLAGHLVRAVDAEQAREFRRPGEEQERQHGVDAQPGPAHPA
ncbi:cobaltochelatase subunit CobT [Babesia caballi]|uniref:Cobaltochelatase subunit CobT n=1 Tax=Babesia caballi TaxID=5871 RepID=A0AAV4LTJ2_BABCB|nr:cobaltochelatase subunit CobT [Babesia caballi]